MTDDICFLPLAQQSRMIAAGAVSSLDLTRAYLDRIAAMDGALHSYFTIAADRALAAAAVCDAEAARNQRRGPLHGIPIGIKDLIDVAGLPTTAGAAHRRDRLPPGDAAVIATLRRAGAVILGKQATAEYAVGGTQFDLPWPPPQNPWNLDCDTGSSSGGSAAAVSAGLCAAAVATETAGSIRAPAAWCGVAGLVPTQVLISRQGVLPLSPTVDCIGPIGRTAADCALMLTEMIDGAPLDPARLATPLHGLRIGIPRHVYEDDPDLDAEVRAAFASALDALRAEGCHLSDLRLDGYETWADTARAITWPEEYAAHGQELRDHPERFGAVTRSRLQDGRRYTAQQHYQALWDRQAATDNLLSSMRGVDVIVLPTMKVAAQPLGYEHQPGARDLSFTRAFNLVGTPALTLPNGLTAAGLPMSIQFIGRPLEDALVLACGIGFETAIQPPLRPRVSEWGLTR